MLNRRFSAINLLMISINGMIGSAWLFAPFYSAKIAGPGAIIAWIIAGAGTVMIALTFAELSTLFPFAGGSAHIPRLSHGTLCSFILSWIAWLSALTMAPIEVQAMLQYAATYFPQLTILKENVPVLSHQGLFWAALLLFLLCLVNAVNYKGLIRSNYFILFLKVIIIGLTISMFIKSSFLTNNFNGFATMSFTQAGWKAIFTAIASGGIAFAFTGFKHGIELAGETKNTCFAIPFAVIGSIICCLILYLGLQIAFIGALHPEYLAKGWHYLSFSGEVGPFAGLAISLGLIWLVKLLYIDAIISPAGAGLIYVTSTARILYAMAESGFMPRIFTYLNKEKFPVVAVFMNFIIGLVLFLPLPSWSIMVSFLVSGMVISYAIGPIALLCLRYEMPNEERHFKLPLPKLICPLAFYFCNLLCYWTGWSTLWKLMIAILMGFILFIALNFRKNLKETAEWKSAWWLLPYLLGLTLISYYGAFGGTGKILFGWDFLIIGLFSVVVFYLAVKSRRLSTVSVKTNMIVESLAS